MAKIEELFGINISSVNSKFLSNALTNESCPNDGGKKCVKVRKSRPDISIGTCCVRFDGFDQPIVICPKVFTGRSSIFDDCKVFLNSNSNTVEVVIVPEVSVGSGRVDYCLVALDSYHQILDYVGIEIQSLDTNGSLWDVRQNTLSSLGVFVESSDFPSSTPSVNWRMSAKTILIQIIQKSEIFFRLRKKLVLACQRPLFEFMRSHYNLENLRNDANDTLHFNVYDYHSSEDGSSLTCVQKYSADIDSIRAFLLLNKDGVDFNKAIRKSINQRLDAAKVLL